MTRLEPLIAAAALAGSAAAPAAAQYDQYQQPYQQQPYQQPYEQQQQQQQQYPQGYPQYPQQQPYQQPAPSYPYSGQSYGNEQGDIVSVVDSLIGNRYAVSDRQAIHSCAWAAVQRARTYGVSGYGGGYNNGYGYGYGYGRHLRVTSINDVERRTLVLRVRGTLGRGYANPGYGGPGYGNPGYGAPGYGGPAYGGYARPEFSFRCDVGYNGYVQDVRIQSLYRGY